MSNPPPGGAARMRNLHNIRIIAVDHGYGNVKTANTITPTGVKATPPSPSLAGTSLNMPAPTT